MSPSSARCQGDVYGRVIVVLRASAHRTRQGFEVVGGMGISRSRAGIVCWGWTGAIPPVTPVKSSNVAAERPPRHDQPTHGLTSKTSKYAAEGCGLR